MTDTVASQAAYVALVGPRLNVAEQSSYVAIVSAREEVSSQSVYLALIDTTITSATRRRQAMVGSF